MLRYLPSTLIMIAILTTHLGCGSDDSEPEPEPTEVEIKTALLTGESVTVSVEDYWTVASVLVDGLDYTAEFQDFSIQFQNNSFTTENSLVVFGESGPWSFTNDAAETIRLGAGLEITLTELTETTLIFQFLVEETIYGRISAVGGRNVFTMTR